MEEQLLKEILESYRLFKLKNDYYFDRGKGTKKYTLDRISVLRSRLLEIQHEIQGR
ncbi:hypothetical protein [uncultured Clostridium sp.]|uniref:hypothetical protein n=1 Tax=uncultured Clostridium sp. TaxID=59620 RepID=UPI00261CA677|nr:hypothetical protein [uncultured Clostridium sp.]